MEFFVASSLIASGIYLNNNKNKNINKNINNNSLQPKNGNNIYDSTEYYNVKDEEYKLAENNFNLSKNPIKNNIIPRYINSVFSNQNMVKNENYDPNLIYSVLDSFDNDTKALIQTLAGTNNPINREWTNIYGLRDQEVSNNPLDQIGGSLLNNRGHENDFTHNNMVPFFGGRIKQNMEENNRMAEGKLEEFTGQKKLNKPHKMETEPFFAPTANLTNTFGSIEQRDLSRYIPSTLGKSNNELPFEQIDVGRGLNDGYTGAPSGGFHNTLRVLPPTLEQLRIDPVLEQEGRILAGKSIEKRALQQQVHKNKTSLLVENKNGERNFITTGQIKGRKIRPKILLKDTGRQHSACLIKPAFNKNKGIKLKADVKITSRQQLKAEPFRNLVDTAKKTNDYGKSGIKNRTTERALNSKGIMGNVKKIINNLKLYIADDAKHTKKQTVVNNNHTYTNLIKANKKHIAFDPKDVARTTIRETTEDFQYNGINSGINKHKNIIQDTARTTIKETTEDSGYVGINSNNYKPKTIIQDQAKTTIKETTEDLNHNGIASGINNVSKHKNVVQDVAKTTIKETTIDFDHLGIYNNANKKRAKVNTIGDVKTTMKETTLLENYTNNIQANKKHITYDPNDVARTTIKETTIDSDFVGIANPIKKQITYDPEDKPDITMKETTITEKYIGNSNPKAGKGYLVAHYDAKPTSKHELSNNSYTGGINSKNKKVKSYEDAYNADLNIDKEIISRGRMPTNNCVKLFNSNLNVQCNKIEDDRKRQYSNMKAANTYNMRFNNNKTLTSFKNNLPENDIRLDIHTLDGLKQNPLALKEPLFG